MAGNIYEKGVCSGQRRRYNRAQRQQNSIRKHPAMNSACRHPRVRIVSRQEDTEYVECLEYGEVFDSEEFRDMEIEDTAETETGKDEV
jgi:hypothetical protein